MQRVQSQQEVQKQKIRLREKIVLMVPEVYDAVLEEIEAFNTLYGAKAGFDQHLNTLIIMGLERAAAIRQVEAQAREEAAKPSAGVPADIAAQVQARWQAQQAAKADA